MTDCAAGSISREAQALARHPDGRALRIAVYLQDMSGGGAEAMRANLIAELRRAGAEVVLLLHQARGENLARLPPDVAVTGFGGGRVASDLWPLARYLRRHRPDILLSSLDHNNLVAAVAGLLAGGHSRVIVTQHNALSEEARGGWKYRIVPAAYRLVAPLVSGIVAVSAGVADDLAQVSGIRRGRIRVIYNPVIDPGFAARASQPVSHPWFELGQPPVFITAGRLVAQKDHATLLAAFAIYRAGAPARLMILGDGPGRPALRARAGALGIAEDVAFLGYVANPLPYYRRAAAFVLSSRFEGFGNVLVEAMGCGLPVIATDCPHGPAEILRGGVFGPMVPVGDARSLAAAMSPTLRGRYPSETLRARAGDFTSEASALATLRLMRDVLLPRRATPAVPTVLVLAGGGVAPLSGGVGTLMLYLMEEFARRPDAPAMRVIDTRGSGGKAAGAWRFLAALAATVRAVASGRVNLVHAHMTTRGSVVRKCILCGVAYGFGVKVILHMHGADFQPFYRGLHPALRAGLRAVLRRARTVIVLGRGWRDFLVGEVGVDATRVAIVPNGVKAPIARHAPADPPLILFLGRLGARKGVPQLIEALGSPSLRSRDWRAVIAGDGDAAPFRAAVTAAGLGDRVSLPGWVGRARTAALLAEAAMLVLPSHHEAMPIAVLEAMAAGVPVIATPVGSIPEILRDDVSALLVPPGSPGPLGEAIGRLLDQPATAVRLAEAAHAVFAGRLEIGVVAADILRLYRAALAGETA